MTIIPRAHISKICQGLLLTIGFMLLAHGGAVAQLKMTDSGEPIEVLADQLDYDDETRHARFTGNVLATQGKSEIYCQELDVFYKEVDGENVLEKLVAKVDVLIITEDGEEATADIATYMPDAETMVLEGDVVIKQGENVISGPKVEIETATGKAKVSGGRVRTFLQQQPEQNAEAETPDEQD